MSFEEELKHVATYLNIYEILWDGPKKFDVAKQYLMREYGKPESTARSYITSIRNGNTGLMTVDKVAGNNSNIGQNRISELLKIPRCPFVLYAGRKKFVKRREFETISCYKH